MSPAHRSLSVRTIAVQKEARCTEVHAFLVRKGRPGSYFLVDSFHGLHRVPTFRSRTLASLPPPCALSRRYSFWHDVAVAGSTEIGPRGLFGSLKFLSSSMVRSGSSCLFGP